MTNATTNPNPNLWWKHRRRMAYTSLIWIIAQTFLWATLSFFSPVAMGALGAVVAWSYGAPMAVLLGYFGNTLAEEIIKRKSNW